MVVAGFPKNAMMLSIPGQPCHVVVVALLGIRLVGRAKESSSALLMSHTQVVVN